MNALNTEAQTNETGEAASPDTPTGRGDVYARVTGRIVAQLEAGVRPWQKPWDDRTAGGRVVRPLRASGEPYRGVNVLTLWLAAAENGYPSPFWFTFRQAKELGGFVRKGERGALVVYANTMTKTERVEDGVEAERDVFFMKGYTVFNACQMEGLPAWLQGPLPEKAPPEERVEAADAFFRATGADVRHGGGRAFYRADADFVRMPPFSDFRDREGYYSTLAHEMTHWTGHATRLARELGAAAHGREAYAREELVAEIGAAFLSADLGLSLEPREDHAAYISFWLALLKHDTRAVFRAAAHAQRAADFLHGLQPRSPD